MAGVRSLMMLALAFAAILLLSNLPLISNRLHPYLSSVPLAVAGLGYAILQLRAGPPRGTLFKRLLLAATFVIWAVDQLLPSGRLATLIGDVVIAAYVLDLFWLSQEQTSVARSTPDSDRQMARLIPNDSRPGYTSPVLSRVDLCVGIGSPAKQVQVFLQNLAIAAWDASVMHGSLKGVDHIHAGGFVANPLVAVTNGIVPLELIQVEIHSGKAVAIPFAKNGLHGLNVVNVESYFLKNRIENHVPEQNQPFRKTALLISRQHS